MKLLLIIVGALAAIVCTEKSAEAEQNYPWCINKPDTPPQCRYTNNAWRIGLAKAGPVHPVPLLGIASVNEAPDALNGYGPSNVNAQGRRGRCLFLSKMKP